MSTTTRIGRLGTLAVGLGIGAALAATPGTASADDVQISIDGFDLFPTAGNTATATSGMGDIAIAIGNGSTAEAEGGFGDFALVDGTNSLAVAGDTSHATGSNFDFASVFGNLDDGEAGEQGSFDSASIFGNHSDAGVGFGDLATPATITNFDSGLVVGNNSVAGANFGSNDLAFVFDPFGSVGSHANAAGTAFLPGNFDLAGVFGDDLNQNSIGDLVFHIAQFF